MNLKLQSLSIDDGDDIYNMLQNIEPEIFCFHNPAFGLNKNQFKDWLNIQYNWSLGVDLPKNYVKQWTFWLIYENLPIGYGKLRERSTSLSIKSGGNIGYAIHKDFRGKGFGKIFFKLLIDQAKIIGINEIYSTVLKENIASHIIHISNNFKVWKEDDNKWYYHRKL